MEQKYCFWGCLCHENVVVHFIKSSVHVFKLSFDIFFAYINKQAARH